MPSVRRGHLRESAGRSSGVRSGESGSQLGGLIGVGVDHWTKILGVSRDE